MADHRSAAALAAAERLYQRKPDASTEEFRKVCERADPEISKLDNREFNASYVLPFRRSAALRGKTGGKRRKKKTKRTTARKTTRKKAKRKAKRKAKKKAKRRAFAAGTAADFGTVQRVAQMIRERDAELFAAAGDLNKIYDIAAHVEAFAAEVVEASGH